MDLADLEALETGEGQALLHTLSEIGLTPQNELSTLTSLRREYPARLVSTAIEQTLLRQKARVKFSLADRMYLTSEGLEQASAEVISAYRARRYEGFESVADLCCGIGGDLISLAKGRRAVAVDSNPLHLRMAEFNALAYGADANLTTVNLDVTSLRLPDVPAAFIDPARRRAGRRTLHPESSSPPLSWCFGLIERIRAVGIKAAPGLPPEAVPSGWEVEFISVRGSLKEAALWSPALATAECRATLLPEGATLIAESVREIPCDPPGRYLYDPDPAIARAGLVEELAHRLDAWKLDPRIAFLSSDRALETPFARTLRVEASQPWALKPLRKTLHDLRIGAVDIRKRGSAVDVSELASRLKLRGERRGTVVLTRVLDKPWTLVCTDVQADHSDH